MLIRSLAEMFRRTLIPSIYPAPPIFAGLSLVCGSSSLGVDGARIA